MNPIQTVTPALDPENLVIGDFNHDGKRDVALIDPDSQTSGVYVHLGNGDGTFQQGTFYSLANCDGVGRQMIAADFNKDRNLDLAVACQSGGSDETYVLLGNPDGTFGSPTSYAVGGTGVAAADINKDGKVDLIVSGVPGNDVSVLLGNGDGTFGTPISTPVQGNIWGNIVVADLNGDGKLDIAMPGAWEGVLVLLGNGNGTFKSPQLAWGNLYSEFQLLVAGDYNQDGKTDLAAVSYIEGGEGFSILTNNGDGSFGVGKDMSAGPSGGYPPEGVVTGDFNGDGKLDLAVTGYNSSFLPSVNIYLGQGNGTFKVPVAYRVGNNPQQLVAADFNHDGKLDLAVANQSDNTISLLLGAGTGTFASQLIYATGAAPTAIAVGDLNNDGKPDLVVGDEGDSNITVLLGNGDGTFQTPTYWNTGANGNNSIAIADFNGDGDLDIAVSSVNTYQVALFFGNGDGTFQSPRYLNLPQINANVASIASASVRGNGLNDLIVAMSNQVFFTYRGNGDGTFADPIGNYTMAGSAIQFADFNGDGKLDVAMVGYNSAVGISLGNGDGTFGPQMLYSAPHTSINGTATSLAIADFNRDGSPDVAVTSWGGPDNAAYLSIFLSNPVAVFSSSSLNFGKVKVGTPSTLSLTVTNQSPTALVVKGITITGTFAPEYSQTNTCGNKVAPYGNCTVTVTFTPSGTGAENTTLNFADSAVGPTRHFSLRGTGTN